MAEMANPRNNRCAINYRVKIINNIQNSRKYIVKEPNQTERANKASSGSTSREGVPINATYESPKKKKSSRIIYLACGKIKLLT